MCDRFILSLQITESLHTVGHQVDTLSVATSGAYGENDNPYLTSQTIKICETNSIDICVDGFVLIGNSCYTQYFILRHVQKCRQYLNSGD